MRTRPWASTVAVATMLCRAATLSADPPPPQDGAPSPRVISAWYAVARSAPATPVQLSRVLAMVHTAMHDAVNGADPRYETYASHLGDERAHPEAAAAAAARRVLSGLFPARQASWDEALAASLAAVPDGGGEDAGVALGAAVGQVILDLRADDGWDGVDPFEPVPGPGVWRPTPPALTPMTEPQFHKVRPFSLERADQFRLQPPPSLTSHAYRRAFEGVKSLGRDTATRRTPEQTHIAHFWFEPPYDTWSRIAGIVQANKRYDLHQTARLYALVNMVICDGLIAGWHGKRQHAFWRPITAIREADTDGNPRTAADAEWSPLRTTPSHPDHPSTHSVCGGAAAEVLRLFVGSDRHPFCMTSLTATPPGSTRCLQTFTQAQDENGLSRVYAGLHFSTAVNAGDRLGRRIGRFAFQHALRPLHRRRGNDVADSHR